MMPAVPQGKCRISAFTVIEWLDRRKATATCPNCGVQGTVEQVLEVDYRSPRESLFYHLQRCPGCTVLFADELPHVDYGDDELIEIGWPGYYAQMGVGTWPIAAALAPIMKPPGTRALEIGGAYGFGLDFCVHGKGWQGVGYDPSPLARVGRETLGLEIVQGMFMAETLAGGPWDVIVATELIEHLEEPRGFLELMRQAVAEDGVLMLTTPAVEYIGPELAALELDRLIVPNRHVMLHSAQSLRQALVLAGFAHVRVVQKRSALVAYASPAPLVLDEDECTAWQLYRRYMEARAARAPLGGDIQFGFAGRALFDAVNDGDDAAAEAAWASLNEGTLARFGYRLDALGALPDGAATATLMELGNKMPFGLGMMLFARSMQLLARGASRQTVRSLMVLALEAVAALQAALAKRALGDDWLSSSIAETLHKELLLCDAEAGRQAVVTELLALGDGLTGWRGFVGLVNAGAYEAASRLRDSLESLTLDADLPEALRQDVRLTSLYLSMNQAEGLVAVPERLALVLEAGVDRTQAKALVLGAFVTLVNGQAFAAAKSLLIQVEPYLLAMRLPYEQSERDALFAAGVLFLQDQETWPRSAASFTRLRDSLARHRQDVETPLFWPALRGEVVALQRLGRNNEVHGLLKTYVLADAGAPEDLKELLGHK